MRQKTWRYPPPPPHHNKNPTKTTTTRSMQTNAEKQKNNDTKTNWSNRPTCCNHIIICWTQNWQTSTLETDVQKLLNSPKHVVFGKVHSELCHCLNDQSNSTKTIKTLGTRTGNGKTKQSAVQDNCRKKKERKKAGAKDSFYITYTLFISSPKLKHTSTL